MKKLIYSQEDLDLMLSLEIEEKDKELDQSKNNWEELKKWLEDEIIINKTNQIEDPNNPEWYIKWNCYLNLLNKMKELEEGK